MAPSMAVPAFSDDNFPPLSALLLQKKPSPKAISLAAEAVRKPGPASNFLALPLEIRNEIYAHLLVHDRVIDITIPHKKRGVIPARFKKGVPDLKDISILGVCQQTRREGMEFMYSFNRFFSKNTDTISKLPNLLSEIGTSYMKYLDLSTHFLLKIHNRNFWSKSLDFVIKKLPSLKKFRLMTEFGAQAAALVETSGISRFGQERRALLKFGAFLTHRHPILKCLIWRAHSGPTYDPNEQRVQAHVELLASGLKRSWETVEKYEKAGDKRKKTFEDFLLDSTAIRRVAWLDLSEKPVSDFAIDRELSNSEVEEMNSYYDIIHNFGYLTIKELREKDANHLPSIDEMIRDAERNTLRAGRGNNTRGRRGQYATEMGLGQCEHGASIGRGGERNRGARHGKFRRGWGPLDGSRQGRGGYFNLSATD